MVSMLRVRDVEQLDEPASELLHRPDGEHAEPDRERVVVLPAEDRVLPQGHVQDEALSVAVLGDEADAGVADLAACRARRGRRRPARSTRRPAGAVP